MEGYASWMRYGFWNNPMMYRGLPPQYPIWNLTRYPDFFPTMRHSNAPSMELNSPTSIPKPELSPSPTYLDERWYAGLGYPAATTLSLESSCQAQSPAVESPLCLVQHEGKNAESRDERPKDPVTSSSQQQPKKKRARTAFSGQQLTILEEEFGKRQYINGPARGEMADKLGLTESQVKIWWQNRRIKQRRLDAAAASKILMRKDVVSYGQSTELPPCSALYKGSTISSNKI